ncbi:MAG: hypothetical protein ISR64_05330 [Deltaproteobacteria bacterium]|nr:hypothetical protein [Deltaproteobacteria bacterium]
MENVSPDLKKIEEFGPLHAEAKKIRTQTRWISLGFVLLIVVAVIGWVWSVKNHFENFDVDQFGTELTKKADKSWPMISEELTKLFDSVLPIAEASIEKELEKAATQIAERFEAEAKTLQTGLKTGIKDTMKKHLVLQERSEAMKAIQAAFPAFADEKAVDQLATALQESFLKSTETELLKMAVEYHEALIKFESAFRKIKAGIPEGQRPATLEAVLALWIEIVYEKMGGDSEFEATAPKKKKGKGKSKGKK